MIALKLPFEFDVQRIQQELAQFTKVDYQDIYNSSVTLETLWLIHFIEPILGDDGLPIFLPNAALKKCPYMLSIFEKFKCNVETFRIHTLDPGASIKEHRDVGYSFERGKIRLHIPIYTNDKVEMIVDKKIVPMQEGECWYCNFDLAHEVKNNSEFHRTHIILDCLVNDWLTDLFENPKAQKLT